MGKEPGRVAFAIKGIQKELNAKGYTVGAEDGYFLTKTYRGVKLFQEAHGLIADGIYGPMSAKKMWLPLCFEMERIKAIPDKLHAGQIALESGQHIDKTFDPGAQGENDPRDRGLAQINSRWHPDIGDDLAYDGRWAIQWAATNLRAAYDRLHAWDPAVAYHNNPSKAHRWAETGSPPDNQIRDYVAAVRRYAGLL